MDWKYIVFALKILVVMFLSVCAGEGLVGLTGLSESTLYNIIFALPLAIVLYATYWVENTIRKKNDEIDELSRENAYLTAKNKQLENRLSICNREENSHIE